MPLLLPRNSFGGAAEENEVGGTNLIGTKHRKSRSVGWEQVVVVVRSLREDADKADDCRCKGDTGVLPFRSSCIGDIEWCTEGYGHAECVVWLSTALPDSFSVDAAVWTLSYSWSLSRSGGVGLGVWVRPRVS